MTLQLLFYIVGGSTVSLFFLIFHCAIAYYWIGKLENIDDN